MYIESCNFLSEWYSHHIRNADWVLNILFFVLTCTIMWILDKSLYLCSVIFKCRVCSLEKVVFKLKQISNGVAINTTLFFGNYIFGILKNCQSNFWNKKGVVCLGKVKHYSVIWSMQLFYSGIRFGWYVSGEKWNLYGHSATIIWHVFIFFLFLSLLFLTNKKIEKKGCLNSCHKWLYKYHYLNKKRVC